MGAPKGNINASHAKPYTEALRKHIIQNPKELAKIVKVQMSKALQGDNQTISQILDRLEGKPAQSLTLEGGEHPIVSHMLVELVAPKAK